MADDDFTEEELEEIAAIKQGAIFRSKLVHQAKQVIEMDAQLTTVQMQGVRDRKCIRELEKQLKEARAHGHFMGVQQIQLLMASDPEKLRDVFPEVVSDG